MLNLINTSNWLSLSCGNKKYYSPNTELIAQLAKNPQAQFWQTIYTEFACVIVDNVLDEVQLVRDHFGCKPFFII